MIWKNRFFVFDQVHFFASCFKYYRVKTCSSHWVWWHSVAYTLAIRLIHCLKEATLVKTPGYFSWAQSFKTSQSIVWALKLSKTQSCSTRTDSKADDSDLSPTASLWSINQRTSAISLKADNKEISFHFIPFLDFCETFISSCVQYVPGMRLYQEQQRISCCCPLFGSQPTCNCLCSANWPSLWRWLLAEQSVQ